MNPDISFLHELWDSVKPFVPKKERLAAAEAVVRSFDDNADIASIEDHVSEFDSAMRAAIVAHFELYDQEDSASDEDDGGW
jgi:hypothetical protein